MHAILTTIGTDGDVFPYLGLASELRRRGHRVTLAAPETYRSPAEALGIEFCDLVTAAEISRVVNHPDLWHPLRSGVLMARWGTPLIARQYEMLARLARESQSVLVANPGVLAARLVQERLAVPTATLLLQPGLLPSCTAPPTLPGGVSIPSWMPPTLRPIFWLGPDATAYVLIARQLNRFRGSLKLPPIYRVFRWWLSPDLVVGLFPSWYAAPQPDWPRQLRLAGFSRFDGLQQDLTDDVRAFCQEGSPPIAFTLGTGMAHAATFFRAAVETCAALGARGILLTKFVDAVPVPLPPTIRHFAYVPFRRLFPQCGAVVHHGGIGTTAAALQSACPQLVLPLAWDQPDNAARLVKLGVATTVGRQRRDAQNLTAALAQLMNSNIGVRCREISVQADEQDGLATAASLVENFAAANSRQ